MGKECLRENLAQLVVNRRSARGNAVTAAVAAEGTEKGTVGRARVNPVKAVDDMEALLEGFERGNGFGQLRLRERAVRRHPGGDTGRGIEALVLQEKDDPFGTAGGREGSGATEVGEHRGSKSGADAGGDGLKRSSASDHMGFGLKLPGRGNFRFEGKSPRHLREQFTAFSIEYEAANALVRLPHGSL